MTRRLLAFVLAIGALCAVGDASAADRPPTAGLRILFSAEDRSTGRRGIYFTEAGSDEVRRLTPDDDGVYTWPTWAFGGTHVIYTARFGPPGSAEEIYLMKADGTDSHRLTDTGWRNSQPTVSANGRTVIFTSAWDEYPVVGVYSLDLETLQVTNLSAVGGAEMGASDSDPRWAPDGTFTYARSFDDAVEGMPTQIWAATDDGAASRRPVVADRFSNVDPSVSPDGAMVAFGSYRGPGTPAKELSDADLIELLKNGGDVRGLVKIAGWHLVAQDLQTGDQRVLTEGIECDRPAEEPCRPEQAAAFVPRWTPDAEALGYVAALAHNTTCICVVDRNGGDGRALVQSSQLDIDWFDWAGPAGRVPDSLGRIGTAVPDHELLFVGTGGQPGLHASGSDRFGSKQPDLPPGLVPLSASLSPDRRLVAFSARKPFDARRSHPTPRPPRGERRQEHFTLEMPWLLDDRAFDPANAEEQIFLLERASGAVRQLTTPWTEDYMDGAHADDPRANSDPAFSPDGRFVIFTNRSTKTSESFLLRLDLTTGEVYSLTNATAGAVAVADSGGRYSPDGSRIAFATARGEGSVIAVMGADGNDVRSIVEDGALNVAPAWSPDGRFLAYATSRDPGLLDHGVAARGWSLVRVDVATGEQVELTDPAGSAFRPVWSPDGTRIAFVGAGRSRQPDLYVVGAGGRRTAPPKPIQTTLLTHEVTVDWR